MADDFRQEIQLVADQALRTLSDLDKRTEVYTRAIEKQIRGVQAFNKANGGFIAGLKAQQNQLVANARAAAQLGAANNSASNSITNITNNVNRANTATQGLTLSYNSLVRLVTSQFVSRGIGGLLGEFRDATTTARELEVTIGRIQTLDAEFRGQSRDAIGNQLASLSGQFGQPIEELATGLYDTLSNQIEGVAGATTVLTEALRLQRLVGGDSGKTVDLLTAGINAYGLSVEQSIPLTEKLFKTIDFGRVTADELGNSIGRVFAPAAQLGVSLDEVLAAVAGATTVGTSARESLTQLGQVIQSLAKPSEALQQVYDELGITSIELAVQTDGLFGVLTKLSNATDGTAESLNRLFPNIRASRFLAAFLGEAGDKITGNLDAIANSTGKLLAEREKLVSETPAQKLNEQIAAFQSTIVNGFGRDFNAALANVIEQLGGGERAAQSLLTTLEVGLPIVGAILTKHLVLTTAAAVKNLFNLGETGTTTLGRLLGFAAAALTIRQLANSYTEANSRAAELRTTLDTLGKTQTADRQAAILATAEDVTEAQKNIRQQVKSISDAFNETRQLRQQRLSEAKLIEEQITGTLFQQVQTRLSILERFTKQSVQIQEQAQQRIEQLGRDRFGIEFDAANAKFQRQLGRVDARTGERLTQQRITSLLKLSREAIGKEQLQISGTILDQAAQLANSIAGRRQNEIFIQRVLKERLGLNDALVAQENKKVQEAKAAEQEAAKAALGIRNRLSLLEEETRRLEALRKAGNTGQEFNRVADNITRAAGEVDRLLVDAGASLGEILTVRDFRRQVQQLREPIQSAFTGKPITLEFAVEEGLDRLREKIGTALGEQNVTDSGRRRLGQIFGIDGERASLGEFERSLKQLGANAENLEDKVRKANAAFGVDKAAQLAAYDQAVQAVSNSFKDLDNAFLGAINQQDNEGLRRKFLALTDGLRAATEAGDAEKITELLAKVQEFSTAFAGLENLGGNTFGLDALFSGTTGFKDLADSFNTAAQAVGEIGAKEAEVSKLRQELFNVRTQIFEANALLGAESPINRLNTQATDAAGAVQGLNNVSSNIGTSIQSSTQVGITALGNLEAQARRTAAAVAAANGSGASNGGTFANGGRIGVDSRLGLFQSGESVVNRAASARFPGVVTALNSGFGPSRFANGGVVNNIGDINLNVSTSDGSAPTGKQLAADLRRELRRRTSRN